MTTTAFLRAAGVAAIVAAVAALTNLGLMVLAVDGDLSRLYDLGGLHDVDEEGARWLIASMAADALFYLGLVPLALALARPGAHPFARATRASGVLYGVVGAAGAMLLVIKWPPLLASARAGSVVAEGMFRDLTELVYRYVWNLACASLGAVWWLSTAYAHRRSRRVVAVVSLALGSVSALEALLVAVGALGLATAILDVYLALLPLFALTAGVSLLRRGDVSVRAV